MVIHFIYFFLLHDLNMCRAPVLVAIAMVEHGIDAITAVTLIRSKRLSSLFCLNCLVLIDSAERNESYHVLSLNHPSHLLQTRSHQCRSVELLRVI